MHRRWQNLWIVFVLGIGIPAGMLTLLTRKSKSESKPHETTNVTQSIIQTEEQDVVVETRIEVNVLFDEGTVECVDLEEYITGVVLAEMPVSFEVEALKAQAVVARTYTLRRCKGNNKHAEAAVCTNPSCCQGYRSVQEYLDDGGSDSGVKKVRKAVNDTKRIVLVYNSELIEATYFSCSGGMTEDAAAVWGTDVPYLKATFSPGEEHADSFVDSIYIPADEFRQLLGLELSGSPDTWIGNITYTAGMGVDTIQIGSTVYDGTQLRCLLGLRSTAFSITPVGDTIVITTKGYGHRVGMSQYGADAMAVNGCSYQQILAHYYQGTELTKYNHS